MAANGNASDKRWRWITMALVIGCRRCASATAFVPASLEPRSGNHEYNTLVVYTVKKALSGVSQIMQRMPELRLQRFGNRQSFLVPRQRQDAVSNKAQLDVTLLAAKHP
jgi:hypothetical protein